jgi:hypothetical protein
MIDPLADTSKKTIKRCSRFFAALPVLIVGIAAAVALPGQRYIGADNPAADHDALREKVGKRVQAWQPSKEERRLDEIGWAKDIRDALGLANQHHRPVFFFSYSGTTDRPQAMATQRC